MPILLTFAVCLLSGSGCTDEPFTAPRGGNPAASEGEVVSSGSLCARVEFTITSSTAVLTAFPDRNGCASGLVVIRGPAATWARNPDRQLRLFLRILNHSGVPVRLPVRLLLPSNQITVLTPANASPARIIPYPDTSVESSGPGPSSVWWIGGTGTLAANDSTALDTLVFTVKSPVTRVVLGFNAGAEGELAGPPPVPNTLVVPDDSLQNIRGPVDTGIVFFRTMAQLQLKPGTSGNAFSALLQKYQAQVVGGSPFSATYIIRYPDPGATWAQFIARLDSLAAEPIVRRAMPMTRYEGKPLVDLRPIEPPVVPSAMNLPEDSTFTLLYPADDSARYYRNILGIVFDDTSSSATISRVFQRFGATVSGGVPNEGSRGAYVVTIPDPGTTPAALDAVRFRIGAAGGVRYVFPIPYRGRLVPRGPASVQ